jgi:hypothetical protein
MSKPSPFWRTLFACLCVAVLEHTASAEGFKVDGNQIIDPDGQFRDRRLAEQSEHRRIERVGADLSR